MIPIFREYDPVQKLLVNLWQLATSEFPNSKCTTTIKIISSLYYTTISCYGASVVYTVMLFLCLLMVEACTCLSYQLLYRPTPKNSNYLRLQKCLKIYRLMQILIQINCWITFRFLTVLVTMGTLATAWGGYVMLSMYDTFPFVIYLSCSVIFFFCLSVNFLLVTLSGIPNRNCNRFREVWRGKLLLKRNRLILRSCPEIGFPLGCVKHVKFRTALEISHVMINCTVTLVLAKMNNGKSWR